MSDMTRAPESAETLAGLGACIVSELLAFLKGISALSHEHWDREHAEHLIGLATRHAEEWVEHFKEQAEMHEGLRKKNAGGKS